MNNSTIVNHKFLRKATGIIALFLAFVVQLLSNHDGPLSSISFSYWTESRDLFVGGLAAVAFFMIAYNGKNRQKKDLEYWLSKAAGFFAIFVALFPTDSEGQNPAEWVVGLTGNNAGTVHNIAAISLFVCLFVLITFFAKRAKEKGKLMRSRTYKIISYGMLFGMPGLYFLSEGLGWSNTVYLVEVLGLLLFGIGWLVAGSYRNDPAVDQ